MEGLEIVAQLMAIAARTAPKSAGEDFIEIKIVDGQDVKKIGEGMIRFGEEKKKRAFDRDGKNTAESDVIVLIGIRSRVFRATLRFQAARLRNSPGICCKDRRNTQCRQPYYVQNRDRCS
jgi:uncharacterized ferredoxin-like protein